MRNPDLFEERLGIALRRYADEVPTDVDAAEVARSVAAAEQGSTWRRIGGLLPLRAASLIWAMLVMVAVPAVLAGALLLTHEIAPSPYPGTLYGSMACGNEPWITGATGATLECHTRLPDPRTSATARIVLHAPTGTDVLHVWSGVLVVGGQGASWSGPLKLTATPNGVVSGNAVLHGEGRYAGLTLQLHLVTDDGAAWGLTGTMSKSG